MSTTHQLQDGKASTCNRETPERKEEGEFQAAVVLLACLELGSASRLVCYFTSWAQYRPGEGKFKIDDLDPCLCTHLIYAFAGMKDNKITNLDANDLTLYHSFNNLKNKNQNLKTLLSVGGWNFGTQKFSAMVSTKENRQTFITSEMVAAFEVEAKSSGQPRMLLSAAVAAGMGIVEGSYEVAELG
ncbi:hypothetical protein scyTo_0022655, partial [Scyliorhinus torazame]|nr:hypothetical protein [Scyliorhinus torazame]